MSQRSLSSFFKPKRPPEASSQADQPLTKVAKVSDDPDQRLSKVAKVSDDPELARLKIGPSWSHCLLSEIKKPYFAKLEKFVANERLNKTIYPSHNEVFSWSRHCQFEEVKVVILGQDPYHAPNQAHGLCFSVKLGVSTPPSLKNIYRALGNDLPEFSDPGHGYLVGWARQGVLLLNTVLTVERARANSHRGHGWELLTDTVIRSVSEELRHCVFLLWGTPAKQKEALIDKKKHLVLTSVHPSPLSAHRGFLDCGHFSRTNSYLLEHGRNPIKWADLPSM